MATPATPSQPSSGLLSPLLTLVVAALLAPAGATVFAQNPSPALAQSGYSSSLDQFQPDHTQPDQVQITSAANTQPGMVLLPEDTLLHLRTNAPLDSRHLERGSHLLFTIAEDVTVDGRLAIPRGTAVSGLVADIKKPGRLSGSPVLTLQLTALRTSSGQPIPLQAYPVTLTGKDKASSTKTDVKDGTVVGALVGGAFSGSAKGATTATGKAAGMATGATLGAGVGTAVSAATRGPELIIPSESPMDFQLAAPIALPPISPEEAARLAHRQQSGTPTLIPRDSH